MGPLHFLTITDLTYMGFSHTELVFEFDTARKDLGEMRTEGETGEAGFH
jgi:hypothetical protein